jgi:hypothetical protein
MVRTSRYLSVPFILLMDSSPGFGSYPSDENALFGLAFAPAPAMYCLSHATENKVVGSLGKRNAVTPCGAPTRCSHHISETISSPFRGAFHLSLTVLSAIDLSICLALEGGPPRFGPDFSCPTLLRVPHRVRAFRLLGCHRLWPTVPGRLPMLEQSNIGALQPL